MDVGVIAAFKAWFRREQGLRAVDMADDIVSGANGGGEFYKVDISQAMRWCQDAWESVTQSTTANCWTHAGILPDDIFQLCKVCPKYTSNSK